MMELREIIPWSYERDLFVRKNYKQFCYRELRFVSIVYLTIILLQLNFFKQIQQVSLTELSIKTTSNRGEPVKVEVTRAIEKLSPFHNLEPDAYLDPVSLIDLGSSIIELITTLSPPLTHILYYYLHIYFTPKLSIF